MGLTIGNSRNNFFAAPVENAEQKIGSSASVKTQNVAASRPPKLPAISGSVSFTALGCDTERKLARASYMAAAAKAGIASGDAQREFADEMIARHSSELSITSEKGVPLKKEIPLDDAKVAESIDNRSVTFHLSPEIKAELKQFRETYIAEGGKVKFNHAPTVDLREPGVVGGTTDSATLAANPKFKVFLNNSGNPTDAKRILAQFAEDKYRGGNLWGQNYTQIAALSAAQGVKPKIVGVTHAGNKVAVEFELAPLDRAKVHENYKTVQAEVNRAVAAYEDFANNNEASSFLRGVFDGALKSVKGTIGLLNLPETMKALWQVVAHPVETFNALSKELGDTWEEFKNAAPNKKSEMVGELVGQAVVEILIGKGIGKAGSILAKTKTGAELLEKTKLVKTAAAAKIAETFSDEAASAAASRLRGRLQSTLYAGIPADALADLAVVATNKVKNGVKDFAEFSKQMIQEVGEKVKPELRRLFDDAFEKVYGKRRTVETHDILGGHTDIKHIGKSIEWLKDRLKREPDIRFASSFKNAEVANRAEMKFVKRFEKEAGEWAKNGDRKNWNFERKMDVGEDLGIVVGRGKSGVQRTTWATFRVVKDETEKGWHIVTSFPSPK